MSIEFSQFAKVKQYLNLLLLDPDFEREINTIVNKYDIFHLPESEERYNHFLDTMDADDFKEFSSILDSRNFDHEDEEDIKKDLQANLLPKYSLTENHSASTES